MNLAKMQYNEVNEPITIFLPAAGGIVFHDAGVGESDITHNLHVIRSAGRRAQHVMTQSLNLIVILENPKGGIVDVGDLRGVRASTAIAGEVKLVKSEAKFGGTEFTINGEVLGCASLGLIFGPCSIQSEKQLEKVARFLADNQIRFMRGGAYKPRSTPYQFQGLALDGLKIIRPIAEQYNLRIVSEITEVGQLEEALPYIDVIQIGTRNAQNVALLRAVGQVDKPVLLKRGFGNTVSEFLGAAEYIYSAGNEKIILCERGIKTFEGAYRNTTDINAIPYLKNASHLPVFADPSHSIGNQAGVEAIGLSALAAGADGLIVEVTDVPEESLTDSAQALSIRQAEQLIRRARTIYEVVRDREF